MRRTIYFVVVGILLTLTSVAAEELEILEGVSATGYVARGDKAFGLIQAESGSRTVQVGDRLGDFQVVSLSADGPFILQNDGNRYAVEWWEDSAEGSASGQFRVRLEEADIVLVAQALAKLLQKDYYCDPRFAGSISLLGSMSSDELLEALLQSAEEVSREELSERLEFHSEVTESELILGTRPTVERVKQSLGKDYPQTKLVSIDFVNAELAYVLEMLAGELGVQAQLPSLEGFVTVTAHNAQAARLFEVCLALQGDDRRAEWGKGEVTVRSK